MKNLEWTVTVEKKDEDERPLRIRIVYDPYGNYTEFNGESRMKNNEWVNFATEKRFGNIDDIDVILDLCKLVTVTCRKRVVYFGMLNDVFDKIKEVKVS